MQNTAHIGRLVFNLLINFCLVVSVFTFYYMILKNTGMKCLQKLGNFDSTILKNIIMIIFIFKKMHTVYI